jgi:hypothetical protein
MVRSDDSMKRYRELEEQLYQQREEKLNSNASQRELVQKIVTKLTLRYLLQ